MCTYDGVRVSGTSWKEDKISDLQGIRVYEIQTCDYKRIYKELGSFY